MSFERHFRPFWRDAIESREKHPTIELSDAEIIARNKAAKVFNKNPELSIELPKEMHEKKSRKSAKRKPQRNHSKL